MTIEEIDKLIAEKHETIYALESEVRELENVKAVLEAAGLKTDQDLAFGDQLAMTESFREYLSSCKWKPDEIVRFTSRALTICAPIGKAGVSVANDGRGGSAIPFVPFTIVQEMRRAYLNNR